MIHAEYSPESRLTTSQKDVRLMLEQGQKYGTPMFLTSIYAHVVQIGNQLGYGDFDPACIIEVFRQMAGLAPRVKRQEQTEIKR